MTDRNLRHEIEQEHDAISVLVRQLGKELETPAIESELKELAGLLDSHFSREEAPDGLHGSIGDRAVNLLPSIEKLSRQHKEIADNLQNLLERCSEHARMARDIRRGARDLVEQLRTHEAEENDVLGHAFYDVLGAGD